MSALIVTGSIVAYLLIGGLIVRAALPKLWIRGWADAPHMDRGFVRAGVIGWAALWLFLWPFMFGSRALARQIDDSDPTKQQRQIAEQKARIAELERELDIR